PHGGGSSQGHCTATGRRSADLWKFQADQSHRYVHRQRSRGARQQLLWSGNGGCIPSRFVALPSLVRRASPGGPERQRGAAHPRL
ncbi:MAG: hypothetical protein AVDCRST_MAG89-1161, partial [uncultured Gemmatimonadetes bacterium]